MRTFTASRRAIVTTTVGLVLSLSIAACSQISELVAPSETELVGCSLLQFHGDLVAVDGRVIFRDRQGYLDGDVPVDWPDGSTFRPLDDGQVAVVGPTGAVLARTGTSVIMLTTPDYSNPLGIGGFRLCGRVVVVG